MIALFRIVDKKAQAEQGGPLQILRERTARGRRASFEAIEIICIFSKEGVIS
jgi:hypothetical protein